MSKIFLSYRRQDSAGVAGRIYDRLRAHFGDDALFMDIDSIPFGLDFREHINSAFDQCGVLLAVIGPHWAGEAGAPRRIDDPRDFVRIEVEAALERKLPVIPILIDRARMPGEADLPPSLVMLAYRNAIEVDQGRDFHPHVDRLIKGIERLLQQANAATAAPPNQPEKPAAVIPAARAREPEQRRKREPVDAGRHPKPPAGHQARPDRSPGAPDPVPPPKTKPPSAGGSKSEVPAQPGGAARSESAPIPTQADPLARGAAVANPPLGTPVKRRSLPGLRVYLTLPPLLAVLGIVIYIITDTGTVKITGTDSSMVVRNDGREIRINDLGEPITLRTGAHDLVVKRGDVILSSPQRSVLTYARDTFPTPYREADEKKTQPRAKHQPPTRDAILEALKLEPDVLDDAVEFLIAHDLIRKVYRHGTTEMVNIQLFPGQSIPVPIAVSPPKDADPSDTRFGVSCFQVTKRGMAVLNEAPTSPTPAPPSLRPEPPSPTR
jgi:hypothetical protein